MSFHADDLASRVDQGRVTRVDRGRSLEQSLQVLRQARARVADADRATSGRDDTGCHRFRTRQREGVADGHHLVADRDRTGVAEGNRRKVGAAVELEEGHVPGCIGADHGGRVALARPVDPGAELGRTINYMVVGQDYARPGQDHARSALGAVVVPSAVMSSVAR